MAGSVLFDAPGPRARARNRVFNVVTALVIALVIWVVFSKLNSKGQLTAAKWEPFLTANLWKTYILPGVQGTLIAAAVSEFQLVSLGAQREREQLVTQANAEHGNVGLEELCNGGDGIVARLRIPGSVT